MREQYEQYLARRAELEANPMGHFFLNQEGRYIEPFRFFGNVCYVGDNWVCTHLVDTGDGLLLIDSGNVGATGMLVHAIWSMGYNPADIKWVVLSHGHLDHIGSAVFLRRMFGSKLYLGEPDARMFREQPELSIIQDSPNVADELFEPDGLIHDGDVKRFGNTEIQFFLVPGHTMGSIACFFDATDGKTTKRVGYYGGFGFNTLTKGFLTAIGDTAYNNRDIYLQSLAKVRDQKVDLFLPNHTGNVNLVEKAARLRENPAENPFLDSTAWGAYLDEKRDALLAFMADPNNN